MTISDQAIPRHHPHTASRIFEGEAVIISPEQNMVRMLNAVGSRIWELVDGSRTIDEIAAILSREFEVDEAHARSSVRDFLRELAELQLISIEEPPV